MRKRCGFRPGYHNGARRLQVNCKKGISLPQLSLPAQAAKTKLLGDVTADGAVSVADGVLLARYVN